MNFNFSRSTLATLCLVWALAILLGVSFGLNIPFILLIAWSLLQVIH